MGFQQFLPLTGTFWICFTVLALVLFIPILCRKLGLPQIAGLIVTGVIVGPGLLHLIETTPEIEFFSQMGLIFIMFFAGLEIDLEEMKRNRGWGITFGILTFSVSWALCFTICQNSLGMSTAASTVIGCIMGSHTLISYPVISRYGLGTRKMVTISVAGSLIAILLALTIYAITQSTQTEGSFSIGLFAIETCAYVAAVIFFYPRLARAFFHNSTNSFSHFLFVMILLALSCALSEAIRLDGILGAFLAGIVLNRYIPKSSPLMNRLDFIGNTLFIPVFLLNTGMLINLRSLISDWDILLLAGILFAAGTLGKWIVAWIMQELTGAGKDDRKLMFGLSESHAAGALAITMGALSAGIIENDTLSAIVLVVLASCIASNVVTERSARRIHEQNTVNETDAKESRLLVMLTGSNTLKALMDTALTIRPKNRLETVGLYITINGEHAPKYLQDGKGRLEEATSIAASADMPFITQNRMGNNVVDSIVHATGEFQASCLLMGLPPRHDITANYYENIIHPLTDGYSGMILLQRMTMPMNTIRRIVALIPGPVIQDDSFEMALDTLRQISKAIGCSVKFYGKDQALEAVRQSGQNFTGLRVSFNSVSENDDMHLAMSSLHRDHLLFLLAPRDYESHAWRAFSHLYERIHLGSTQFSTMILFPPTDNIKGNPEATVRTEHDYLKMLRM